MKYPIALLSSVAAWKFGPYAACLANASAMDGCSSGGDALGVEVEKK